MLRRPDIPTHVLERQPGNISDSTEPVTPNRLMRSLKCLMPRIIDLPMAKGSVFFVTETSPMGYHSLNYKIRESGRIVADRFQAPTGQGAVWTLGFSPVGGRSHDNVICMTKEECKPENQPLMMRSLVDIGIFPILEDPDYIPGDDLPERSLIKNLNINQ